MENELIPIINDNGKRAVDARMLHEFLGSKREIFQLGLKTALISVI